MKKLKKIKMNNFVNIFIVYIVCIVFSNCSFKDPLINYDRQNHSLFELNGKLIKSVSIYFLNDDSSVSCVKHYYKLLDGDAVSYINLENPDTAVFRIENSLNCLFEKNDLYKVVVMFRDSEKDMLIRW